jgi:DMSO reductase anchor subunit/NAD-dependent dihydropyrimidine dehydrogenase PreA subunit
VLAYEQDPVTGIVRHLDDQCIGCQYCVLKCPYDAPKYNARLGIVRKCDLCHGRLAAGEAPACAQSCPTHAIKIVKVSAVADTSGFLPAAPAPDYTHPTTRYRTKRQPPVHLRPADAANHPPQPTHAPLVVMLTLMPAAIGWSSVAALAPLESRRFFQVGALIAGAIGLAASVLHLGQPWRAWRIFLGWRRSWLSREAMLFGAWFAAAAGALVFPSLDALAARLGIGGLVCSAMIYVDTRRALWRPVPTFIRFFGSAVVFATAPVAPRVAFAALGLKLLAEIVSVLEVPAARARVRGPLRTAAEIRAMLGVATLALLACGPAPVALVVALAGEFADRYLFFRAVDAPKMPGMAA